MSEHLELYWIVLAVCLALTAFFNASETALVSLGRVRLRQAKGRHPRLGLVLERVTGNPDRLLSTILLGTTIVTAGASSAATALAIALAPEHPVLVATVSVTVLLLLASEISPKVLAATFPEQFALVVVQPIDLLIRLVAPIVWVFSLVPRAILFLVGGTSRGRGETTSDDIKTIAILGHEEGVIGKDEQEIIHSVVEFGALTAGQLMVSRVDIQSLDLDLGRDEAVDLVIASGHSRIPVYRGSKDHIDGVLQARDYLLAWRRGEAADPALFVRAPFLIPESMRVAALLREFRSRNERMAIVVDEYGGTAGIVTLEDVLAEIVGEVVEEDRDLALLAPRRDGSLAVSGQIAIDDLNAKTGLALPDEEFQTLSGLLVNHLGRVPYAGEEVALGGALFQVLDADQRRIYRLALRKAPPPGQSG